MGTAMWSSGDIGCRYAGLSSLVRGGKNCIDGITLLRLLHIVPSLRILCAVRRRRGHRWLQIYIQVGDAGGDEEERPTGPSILLGIIYP